MLENPTPPLISNYIESKTANWYVPFDHISNYLSDLNWQSRNLFPTMFVNHISDLPSSPQNGTYYYDKDQDDLYEVINGTLSWINGFYDVSPEYR